MAKLVAFLMLTLDGYSADENGGIDWHVVDDEFNEFALAQLNSASFLVFGRNTYEGMVEYWTSPEAMQNDPLVAEKMNTLPKVVLSHTLSQVTWANTRLIKTQIVEEFTQLKAEQEKDLIIMGSSKLCASLINLGLIDEFRLMFNPIILGKGISAFMGARTLNDLRHTETRFFESGNVLQIYRRR